MKLAATAILFALSGASPALAGDADDIRARLEEWTLSFNRGDKAAACELFSPSLLSDVRGQGETGYETRCALLTRAIDDPARRFSYALDIREIIVEGTLAVVRLTWTLTIAPAGTRSVEPGLDVFRKEADGRWRIIRYMAYED